MKTSPTDLGIKLEIKELATFPVRRDKWWKIWQKNISLEKLADEHKRLGNKVSRIDYERGAVMLDVDNHGISVGEVNY